MRMGRTVQANGRGMPLPRGGQRIGETQAGWLTPFDFGSFAIDDRRHFNGRDPRREP